MATGDFDLERLLVFLQQNASLRPYLDGKVRLVGTGTSPLEYRGPMSLASARASTGVGWQWANLYGFQVGPGRANAALSDGVVRIEPMDLAVSGGRMRLAAQLRLAPGPLEMTLPPGPLVSQVQINQRMCDSFMKYIAPVLADVASAKGKFSIDLDNCRIPLSDPTKGDLAGRLTVHSVEVGPEGDELAFFEDPNGLFWALYARRGGGVAYRELSVDD
jgi:translocation and assembly module TamB